MNSVINVGGHTIGYGQPVFIIAEIGINHNGDIELAKRLIDMAVAAGCTAVKFQKRTPELCTPAHMRDINRETPWGIITYLEYRYKVEFGETEYDQIDQYCKQRGIPWLASCWDEPAVDFLERYAPPLHKIPSACLTNHALLRHIAAKGRPVILSTGMSTMEDIDQAVLHLDKSRLILCHTNSTYPCKPEELNLKTIQTLGQRFGCPVGYSGHEVGLQTTCAAVVLGACIIERHITLDRAMWGSDQAASIEPPGLFRLVRDIRIIESAVGDGIKRIYPGEIIARERLRDQIRANSIGI